MGSTSTRSAASAVPVSVAASTVNVIAKAAPAVPKAFGPAKGVAVSS